MPKLYRIWYRLTFKDLQSGYCFSVFKISLFHQNQLILKLIRIFGRAIVFCLILLSIIFSVITWGILPRLNQYRGELEQTLSQASGYQVTIQSIDGHWQGIAPLINLRRLQFSALGSQQPPLTLRRITLKPSWHSLLVLEPRFSLIELNQPFLSFYRSQQNKLYLNGLLLKPQAEQKTTSSHPANWLLKQGKIAIRELQITWLDDYAAIPPVQLKHGNIVLDNTLANHRLQLQTGCISSTTDNISANLTWQGDQFESWQHWSGHAFVNIPSFQRGDWAAYLVPWLDWKQGNLNTTFNLVFRKGQMDKLFGQITLQDMRLTPHIRSLSELAIDRLGGNFSVKKLSNNVYEANLDQLDFKTPQGNILQQGKIAAVYQYGNQPSGKITLSKIHLQPTDILLKTLAQRTPDIAHLSPQGTLSDIAVSWQGKASSPTRYAFSGDFKQLGWKGSQTIPGLSGLNGLLKVDKSGGLLQIDRSSLNINAPGIMKHPLAFDQLNTQISWEQKADTLLVNLKDFKAENHDLAAQLSGEYRYTGHGNGFINISGKLKRLAAPTVPGYLPVSLNPITSTWLSNAFLSGEVRDASIKVRGEVDKFPFYGGKGGEFRIDGQLQNIDLVYGPKWAKLDNVWARMQFINEGLKIEGIKVSTKGVPLSDVHVNIPDLMADDPMLYATGKAVGELKNYLAFTSSNRSSKILSEFTGQLQGKGQAQLAIDLKVPLNHSEDTKVKGDLFLDNNELVFTALPIPSAKTIKGTLHFTEEGVVTNNLTLHTLGGKFTLKAVMGPKQRFSLEGEANSQELVKEYAAALSPFISGHSHFKVDFTVGQDLEKLTATSSLSGTRFNIPAPLHKTAQAPWPLDLTVAPSPSGWSIRYQLGTASEGIINLKKNGTLVSGAVNIGTRLNAVPSNALAVKIHAPSLDISAWTAALSKLSSGKQGKQKPMTSVIQTPLNITFASNRILWEQQALLHNVTASLANHSQQNVWEGSILSQEIKGHFSYTPTGRGLVYARFNEIDTNIIRAFRTLPDVSASPTQGNQPANYMQLPEMDIEVARLRYKEDFLGKLALRAIVKNGHLSIPSISLTSNTHHFQAKMMAYGNKSPYVDSDFIVQSKNFGQLLTALGQDNLLINGCGDISGQLNWHGKLTDITEKALSGHIKVALTNGRFGQLDPGAARLLGVISLQSLSRRVRLDFSDLFNKGFAFDNINGEFNATRGIFQANDFQLRGPTADVRMKGNINLIDNTQHLTLQIKPHLSESVALATGLLTWNPYVGVGVLAGEKLLKDPINKILSLNYKVTGSMDNPQVKKISFFDKGKTLNESTDLSLTTNKHPK